MPKLLTICTIIFLLGSCGNSHNFNKQKYTSLKLKQVTSISKVSEENTSVHYLDETQNVTADLAYLPDKSVSDELKPLIQSNALNSIPVDTNKLGKHKYSIEIQKIIDSDDTLYIEVNKNTYLLKNPKYNKDSGDLTGRIAIFSDAEINEFGHILKISSYEVIKENMIRIKSTKIVRYTGNINDDPNWIGPTNYQKFFGTILLLCGIIASILITAGLTFFGAGWIILPAIPLIIFFMYLIARLNRKSNGNGEKQKHKKITWIATLASILSASIILLIFWY